MPYPSDVSLPIDAKFYGFIDNKTPFNSHWDITWSFTYALTGSNHAICTFLTNYSNISGAIPGQYMGYLGNYPFLLSDSGEIVRTYDNLPIYTDDLSGYEYNLNGLLAICLDSTGYFALSNNHNVGVELSAIKPNSLIIRKENVVIFNESLSSLDPNFILSSPNKQYNTLRFRLSNSGRRIIIDYKNNKENYTNLLTLNYNILNPEFYPNVYPGFTYSSPVSGSSDTPSKLWLHNFHTQGNPNPPTYE
jgi:hypothetical protein